MNFTIEKNVPMPERFRASEYKGMYPFNEMKVGDSFLYKAASGNARARQRLWSAALDYARRWDKDKKFSVRQVNNGYRVWRVK